ncbi:MAG: hypothetical protein HYV27_16590 [Candidatus Hydrogenedentes bacterium]|nr:hypothetical protein [Candidatus Hydrogenedentota bacterium]
MKRTSILATLVLTFAFFAGMDLIAGDAAAQDTNKAKAVDKASAGKVEKAKSADKKQAAKETGTLGSKEIDEELLPGKKEIGLAIGSTIAMIAVMKYW